MFFIGRTRFSLFVPDSEAWRLSKSFDDESINSYRNELYDDHRLSIREDIFLNHTLPTLAIAAVGHDVTHVVSYSESLPEKYKETLKAASIKYPFLLLDEQADGESGVSLRDLGKKRAEPGEIFGLYRLDDDDILPVNFFERMAEFMRPNFVRMVVSFPMGIEAVLHQGMAFNLKLAHFPMNSMGLMHVCRMGQKGRIFTPKNGPHNLADRKNAVVIDSRELGYFRFNHVNQDNALRLSEGASLTSVRKQMARYPDFEDNKKLDQLFPTVRGLLGKEEEKSLLRSPRKVWLPVKVPVEVPASNMSIEVKHLFPEYSSKRQALVSFDIVDRFGNSIDSQLEIPGLGKSSKSAIGFYKYLDSEPESSSTSFDISLPDGFFLNSLTIRRFGLKSKPFEVKSVLARYSASASN